VHAEAEGEYVLITGGDEVSPEVVDSLRAGIAVRRCTGPAENYCPLLHGEHCPLRENARVAIVYMAGEHEFYFPGRWECLVGAASPAVAVLEGNRHSPHSRGGFAVVGSERGPMGVLQAIANLVDNPDT
jgi:hypothetical protein